MAKMSMGAGLIDPRYCCCAVPLVNAGINIILGEQAIVGVVAGVVAIATPTVVGAVVPTFGTYLFAVLCFVVTVVQPIGFIGVIREKTSTFKVYSLLNAIAIAAAFICAAALIIVSALKHNTAVSSCESKFFSDKDSTTSTANETLASESQALCSAFAWADVGIMGALWVILLLLQTYFIYLTRSYSTSQVKDHKLYHSVYSENPEAFTMSILRSTRYNPGSVYNAMPAGSTATVGPHGDAWDARPSMESLRDDERGYAGAGAGVGAGAGAGAYDPTHSGYAEGGQGYRQSQYQDGDEHEQGRYEDAYAEGSHAYPNTYEGYHHDPQAGQGGHSGQYPFSAPGGGYIDHPAEARARDPGITPTANQYAEGQGVGYNPNSAPGYPSGGDGGLRRPEEIQNHPGGL